MLVLPLGMRVVAFRDPFDHRAGTRPRESAAERIGAIARREIALLFAAIGRQPDSHAAAVRDADRKAILEFAAATRLDHLADRLGRPDLARDEWRRRQNLSDTRVPDIGEVGLGAQLARRLDPFFQLGAVNRPVVARPRSQPIATASSP